ncbi:hypothetical protein C8R43DRAFT_1135637 [Mycena crocata]|nr:hypothetical protein C8R43DRAFT_1135637 [Mycena crocata]
MAVYHYDYGDYAYEPTYFDSELACDTNSRHYDSAGYDFSPAETYVPHSEYNDREHTYECYEPEDVQGTDYEAVEEADYGLMQTEYGQPGYWEEYHRRRYDILYGSDFENVEGLPDVYDDATHVAFETAPAPDPYDESDAVSHTEEMVVVEGIEDGEKCIFEAEASDEDELLAWRELWNRGPPIGENELAWAEAMDMWRQRIEADVHSGEESPGEGVFPPEPVLHEELISAAAHAYIDAAVDDDASPLSLDELQAAYDRGEIPEEDREECARMLGELWACELEDQRLLVAGYVWDDELGEYVHPDGSNSSEEYDVEEEEDIDLVEHVDVYSAPDVPDLPFIALAGIHARSFSSHQPSHPETSKRQFAPRRRFPKMPKPRFPLGFRNRRHRVFIPAQHRPLLPIPRAPRSKSRRRRSKGRTPVTADLRRELPPHLALIVSSAESTKAPRTASSAAGTMVPAPSATPPPVTDDSRCSLATVPIVAASIIDTKDPVPPDIPTPSPTTSLSNENPSPDAVIIPRKPEPPNIRLTAATSSSVSSSVPIRVSVTDTVLRVAVPKPPKIPVTATAQITARNSSARRRLNAQRRIAKKGKG